MSVRVQVVPETFTLVSFDAADIAENVAAAAGWAGIDDGEIRVEVDQSVPLTGARVTDGQPIVIWVEGGALEDPRTIRRLSPTAVQTVAVRLLSRVADRRKPGFADAPADEALSVPQADAWDVWALGRASRRGLPVNQQRWRYRFRNRHGFNDVADRTFDRLWAAEELTWAELAALCEETAALR